MLRPEPVVFFGDAQQTILMETAPGWTSRAVLSWRYLKPSEVSSFQSEDLHVSENGKLRLADLSTPREGAQGVCPAEATVDSCLGFNHVRESSGGIVSYGPTCSSGHTMLVGEQLVELASGEVERMKQNPCLVRTALHTSWGPVALDPCSCAVMPGTDDVMIMGSHMTQVLSIDVYSSLGACARARNTSVRCVNTPAFTVCRCVSIAVDAIQQSGGLAEPISRLSGCCRESRR